MIAWTVAELDNDVAGPVILRVGNNLETGKTTFTSSTGADQIVQTIVINNAKICHVGILLADAQLLRTGEPTINRIGRLVLTPEHQIRLVNVMTDAELPPVLADALSDADALLLTVVIYLHGTTVGAGD